MQAVIFLLGLGAQTETSSLLTPNAAVARKCCSESLLVRRSCVGLRRLSRIPHIWLASGIFVDQLALFSGGRPRHTICRAWYQEYEALLREALG